MTHCLHKSSCSLHLDKPCQWVPLDIALDPTNLNLHQGSQFYNFDM